jgi:hypothetical protein
MKRKEYRRPATMVVVLTQQAQLLQASLPGYDPVGWSRGMENTFDEEEGN